MSKKLLDEAASAASLRSLMNFVMAAWVFVPYTPSIG